MHFKFIPSLQIWATAFLFFQGRANVSLASEIDNTCEHASNIPFFNFYNSFSYNDVTEEAITLETNLPIGDGEGLCPVATPEFANITTAPRGYWLQMTLPGTPQDIVRVHLSGMRPDEEIVTVFRGECGALECEESQETEKGEIYWSGRGGTTSKILVSTVAPHREDEDFEVIARPASARTQCVEDLSQSTWNPTGDFQQECVCEDTPNGSTRKVCHDLCPYCYVTEFPTTGMQEYCFRKAETTYYELTPFGDEYFDWAKTDCFHMMDGFSLFGQTYCFTKNTRGNQCHLEIDGNECADIDSESWNACDDQEPLVSACNNYTDFEGRMGDYEILLDILAEEAAGNISATVGVCLADTDVPPLPSSASVEVPVASVIQLYELVTLPELGLGDAGRFVLNIQDEMSVTCVLTGGTGNPNMFISENNRQGAPLCGFGSFDSQTAEEVCVIDTSQETTTDLYILVNLGQLVTSRNNFLFCDPTPQLYLDQSVEFSIISEDEETNREIQHPFYMDVSGLEGGSEVVCHIWIEDDYGGRLQVREDLKDSEYLCSTRYGSGVEQCSWNVPNETSIMWLDVSVYRTTENITMQCTENYYPGEGEEMNNMTFGQSHYFFIDENDGYYSWVVEVPGGIQEDVACEFFGPEDSGASLYVTAGNPEEPTVDCLSYGSGGIERCEFSLPNATSSPFPTFVYGSVTSNITDEASWVEIICDWLSDAPAEISRGNPDLP